ncbi:hypothetical protein TSMEX_000981 [Taenia solium]|eukprot:TsM_000559300 transcript=TsM_000559300 gene=TsM_000559300
MEMVGIQWESDVCQRIIVITLRQAPQIANPRAREEHYWKKPSKHDASDNESTKSSEASAASDDDGEEKIMVERYWKREPSAHKGCEAPSGEEKIIISRLWKKKCETNAMLTGKHSDRTGGNGENGRDKEMPSANQTHSAGPYTSSSKSETSSSSSTSSESSSSSSTSSSESENSASEDSSESDGEFIEHYWTRKTRGHRPESRGNRPPVCQKCGSYKYPRKH